LRYLVKQCVIRSSVGDVFTFRIDGTEATFLGMDDYHDPKYDKMMLSADYMSFIESYGSGRKNRYTGAPLDDKHIAYSIHVYPSVEMEDQYLTTTPMMNTIVIIAVFAFTAFVFVTYDWFVERRQKVVLKTAKSTTAVVSSLFPKNVRHRILDQNDLSNSIRSRSNKKLKISSRLGDNLIPVRKPKSSSSTSLSSDPIADNYPECTVLFADIRGFTAWCAEREPRQVFTLLETVYGAYDTIAKRRKVYKVETIGDCYMAVTGLPEPQPNHAVIMVRFAKESATQIDAIFQNLEKILGPGTSDLQFRVGKCCQWCLGCIAIN
jgi:Adenylate and Guanylate cyclase catalytic domain